MSLPGDAEYLQVIEVVDRLTTRRGKVLRVNRWKKSRSAARAATFKVQKGSGGSSSPSGCRKVTLKNRKYSLTGIDHMYTYTIKTKWCWNRGKGSISDVKTDWSMYIDNDTGYWRGQTRLRRMFYAWSSGKPRSGYRHDRQGEFENCILKYGCTGTSYPRNIIRAHSNGTWTWWTDD